MRSSAALARVGDRELWVGDDDLVFVGTAGGYLDGSALRRRSGTALERAGLRQLRFHDLRPTFGTRMIGKADIRRVQGWMGQSSIQRTMQYLHCAPPQRRRPAEQRLTPHLRVVLGLPSVCGLKLL
jgi:integrase